MKKLFVSSAVALALAGGAVMAEEDGVFVGLGFAANALSIEGKMGNNKQTGSNNAINYEIVAGYKQFFTDSFGLRYYAHFAQNYAFAKEPNSEMTTNSFSYGVNVDALYNFINQADTSFGAFAGLRLGGNTLGDEHLFVKPWIDAGQKVGKTDYMVGINLGLRGMFAKNHGIEAVALIPLTSHSIYEETILNTNVYMKYKDTYKISLRYTYSF